MFDLLSSAVIVADHKTATGKRDAHNKYEWNQKAYDRAILLHRIRSVNNRSAHCADQLQRHQFQKTIFRPFRLWHAAPAKIKAA
jgi:hypothetical protein